MLTESIIENAAMEWFGESYEQEVLVDRFRTSARRMNQALAERDIGTRSITELIGVIKKKMSSMTMTTIFTTVVNSTAS